MKVASLMGNQSCTFHYLHFITRYLWKQEVRSVQYKQAIPL